MKLSISPTLAARKDLSPAAKMAFAHLLQEATRGEPTTLVSANAAGDIGLGRFAFMAALEEIRNKAMFDLAEGSVSMEQADNLVVELRLVVGYKQKEQKELPMVDQDALAGAEAVDPTTHRIANLEIPGPINEDGVELHLAWEASDPFLYMKATIMHRTVPGDYLLNICHEPPGLDMEWLVEEEPYESIEAAQSAWETHRDAVAKAGQPAPEPEPVAQAKRSRKKTTSQNQPGDLPETPSEPVVVPPSTPATGEPTIEAVVEEHDPTSASTPSGLDGATPPNGLELTGNPVADRRLRPSENWSIEVGQATYEVIYIPNWIKDKSDYFKITGPGVGTGDLVTRFVPISEVDAESSPKAFAAKLIGHILAERKELAGAAQ